jgi:hypothetical protein
MWSVFFFFFFFFFFLCHLLNVGACICHIALEGQAEWTTPHHLICCTFWYSIVPHATLIHNYHASMSTLQNSIISRALWLDKCDTTEFKVYVVVVCSSQEIKAGVPHTICSFSDP